VKNKVACFYGPQRRVVIGGVNVRTYVACQWAPKLVTIATSLQGS